MESKKEKRLFSGVVYLALILSGLICACLNGMTLTGALVRCCYAVIIGAVFLLILHYKEEMLWNQIPNKILYLMTLVVSVCLTAVASKYSVGMYWMVLLAVVGGMKEIAIKVASSVFLIAIYMTQAFALHQDFALFEYYLIMGIAFVVILSLVKQRAEIPYAGVILVALSLALLVVQNGFDFSVLWERKYISFLEISSLVFLILFSSMVSLAEDAFVKEEKVNRKLEAEIMGLMQDDFPLMQKLKENDSLYHHCYEISRISTLAAKCIGCNSVLAGAGGMYHEVGRLISSDGYMECNMKLAREHGFPEELKNVIKQHNTGSEVPKSPEAAIVMLSDCIISTGEFLERSGKRATISDEKLVNSIFSNRKSKGSLEQSGLSDEQLDLLEEFYISNTFVD